MTSASALVAKARQRKFNLPLATARPRSSCVMLLLALHTRRLDHTCQTAREIEEYHAQSRHRATMSVAALHDISSGTRLSRALQTSGLHRSRNHRTTAQQARMEIAEKAIEQAENMSVPRKMRVTALLRYPIKSTGAEHLTQAEITGEGLRGDRRFVVTNRDGVAMTQRDVPRLAIIRASSIGNQLHLSTLEGHSFNVSIAQSGAVAPARIFGEEVSLIDQGAEVGYWLEQVLGGNAVQLNLFSSLFGERSPSYKLLYAPDDSWRTGDLVRWGAGLSDASPLHLLCEESLQDLNAHRDLEGLPRVPLERFRPNILISGCSSPHAEADTFQTMQIGNTIFRVTACPRCTVPNVNQRTGKSDNGNSSPMSTLKRFRKGVGGFITFGAYLTPLSCGEVLQVGAEVKANMVEA